MKLFICAFALCLSVLSVSCEKNRFNGLIDEVIYEMEQQMINKSQTVLKLPEISKTFTKKILFFSVDGSLAVSGGSVKNLSSIYRIGDVTPVQNQNDTDTFLSIQGTFGMKDLTLQADMLDFKMSLIHIHDPLTVVVGSNAASFKVTLTFDENMNCVSTLNLAEVVKLGDFSITLGSGLLTDIEDHVANMILDHVAPTVQAAINARLFPMVKDSIAKLNLCEKMGFNSS